MIKSNIFTAEQHLQYYYEFCRGVHSAGGTTPHMLMASAASVDKDVNTAMWRGGMYATVYNYASAEVLWRKLDPEWCQDARNLDELEGFLTLNWEGIKTRRERKCVRIPRNMARCIQSYARYMTDLPNKEWFLADDMDPNARWILAFEDITKNVEFFGRYITIRLIEFYRHTFSKTILMPDIRPKDGGHPRKALALMLPEHEELLLRGGNSPTVVTQVQELSDYVLKQFATDLGVTTGNYQYEMQSLLCEYKQSALSGKQYPGKSIDTSLRYFQQVSTHWEPVFMGGTEFYKVRKQLFPITHLGEEQGWTGVRDELGKVLRNYGYTWDDSLYDYVKSKKDLANPVRRS